MHIVEVNDDFYAAQMNTGTLCHPLKHFTAREVNNKSPKIDS